MSPPIPDRFTPPPLPPSYAPAPTPPWTPSTLDQVLFLVFVVLYIAVSLLAVFVSNRCNENRRRENGRRAQAAAAAAPPPRALPRLEPTRHFEELRRLRQARAANPAARLPAFKYNRYVTGGAEECPVCLGAFQIGETVRLLPLCLHLYHVECIDPWLDAHSTCPICRSDTHPTMDVLRLPPV